MDLSNLPEGIEIKEGPDGKPFVSLKLDKAPKISSPKKIQVLWYSDFLKHTGFGNVAEEIVKRLYKTGRYDFQIIGINHDGSPYNFPESDYYHFRNIPVYPAQDEESVFGYRKLAKALSQGKFDIFFCLQDAFNLRPLKDVIKNCLDQKKFSYIFYFPVDGEFKESWIEEGVGLATVPVVYTEYGKKMMEEISPKFAKRCKILYHGVDLEVFKPMEDEEEVLAFRKKHFGKDVTKEDFIITNVNRNQPRKDIPRTIAAFKVFCERYPHIKARLNLHCLHHDYYGHNLAEVVRKMLPTQWAKRVSFVNPQKFGANGYPTEEVRKVYCASNLITSTSLGEGFGLSTVEAMACGVPVVMPNNTATTEIVGEQEERGYLVKSGADADHFTVLRMDNDILRPLTDVEDLVAKWKHVYDHPEEAKEKAKVALDWIQAYTWDKIAEEWDAIFQKAYFDKDK